MNVQLFLSRMRFTVYVTLLGMFPRTYWNKY